MAVDRTRTVLGMAFLVVLCAGYSVCAKAASGSSDGDNLSIEDTLGLTFCHPIDTYPLGYHVYRRANKDAKSALLRLLANKAQMETHPTALRMLGYVADKGDIEAIIKAVTGGLAGDVQDYQQRDAIVAMMDCFGIMAGRDIEEAAERLRQMADPAYWKASPYQVGRKIDRGNTPAGYEFTGSTWAVEAYALSGRKDVAELAAKVIAAADRPADQKELSSRLGSGKLKWQYEGRIASEKRDIPDVFRVEAIGLYAAHRSVFDVPDASQIEEMAFLKTTVAEALSAFTEMRDNLVKGEVEKLKGRLLDNGEIPPADRVDQLWIVGRADLQREEAILKALTERNSVPGEFTLVRTTKYEFADIPKDGEVKATKSEVVTVTAKMSDSAKITAGSMYTGQRGSLTVAKDGSLIVVMKKIDGKWYWNPFGW